MGYGGDGLVNRKRLGELKEEIGHDEFGEVIEIFVEECDSAAAQLAEGVGEEVGPVLHFLRGAAMNLGLDALAAACLEGRACGGPRRVGPGRRPGHRGALRRLAQGAAGDPVAPRRGLRVGAAATGPRASWFGAGRRRIVSGAS